jgi:phosphinothricin acetyltransferase
MNHRIRTATVADVPSINAIYNYYVPRSTCTYQYDPEPDEARLAWFAKHGDEHPVIVAEIEGEVIGWGSLSPFRSRDGYRHTAEISVYVRHDLHRQGIGKALLAELIERAKMIGHHTLVGGISADQAASIELHEGMGFQKVGHFREIGYKFDQWLDVVFMQLML